MDAMDDGVIVDCTGGIIGGIDIIDGIDIIGAGVDVILL